MRFVELDAVDVFADFAGCGATIVVMFGWWPEGLVGVDDAVHCAVGLDLVDRGTPVDSGEVGARAGADCFEVSG